MLLQPVIVCVERVTEMPPVPLMVPVKVPLLLMLSVAAPNNTLPDPDRPPTKMLLSARSAVAPASMVSRPALVPSPSPPNAVTDSATSVPAVTTVPPV